MMYSSSGGLTKKILVDGVSTNNTKRLVFVLDDSSSRGCDGGRGKAEGRKKQQNVAQRRLILCSQEQKRGTFPTPPLADTETSTLNEKSSSRCCGGKAEV